MINARVAPKARKHILGFWIFRERRLEFKARKVEWVKIKRQAATSFHFRALKSLMLRAEIQLKMCYFSSSLLIAISKGIFQYFHNISAMAGASLTRVHFSIIVFNLAVRKLLDAQCTTNET